MYIEHSNGIIRLINRFERLKLCTNVFIIHIYMYNYRHAKQTFKRTIYIINIYIYCPIV